MKLDPLGLCCEEELEEAYAAADKYDIDLKWAEIKIDAIVAGQLASCLGGLLLTPLGAAAACTVATTGAEAAIAAIHNTLDLDLLAAKTAANKYHRCMAKGCKEPVSCL
jgi:hypothetical protein